MAGDRARCGDSGSVSEGAASMETEILDEIRKVRDEHAKECGYDVHRAFEQMRAETERLKEEGWQVVDRSVPRSVVREEPHQRKE